GVDIPAAVHGGFEWEQQRPQSCRLACVLEDLAHRERTALPGLLTGEGGSDAGAQSADRTYTVTGSRHAIRFGEIVAGCTRSGWTQARRAFGQTSARGAKDDKRSHRDRDGAEDVEVDRRYRGAGPADQKPKEIGRASCRERVKVSMGAG